MLHFILSQTTHNTPQPTHVHIPNKGEILTNPKKNHKIKTKTKFPITPNPSVLTELLTVKIKTNYTDIPKKKTFKHNMSTKKKKQVNIKLNDTVQNSRLNQYAHTYCEINDLKTAEVVNI